jgi:transposase-like protein
MFNPTLSQLELIAEMTHGGMTVERIAAALGITTEVYTAWVFRLMAVRALDPQAVDRLLYPPRPVAIKAPPVPHDPRILAEHMFAVAAE